MTMVKKKISWIQLTMSHIMQNWIFLKTRILYTTIKKLLNYHPLRVKDSPSYLICSKLFYLAQDTKP